MVFKRYIHRHGKKLGPYYYENIRGPDGSIRTVYIGTNPRQHPKHKVRRPLFFLIVVLLLVLVLGGVLFFLQNKPYLIKKVRGSGELNFDADQILLKVLVRSKEFMEKDIRIMNTGADATDIIIEVFGVSDIVKTDSAYFTLKPGQTKIARLNFSSFFASEGIEQQPGVYIGKLVIKSEKGQKEIPIVIEIETKNVLFDMNLNPVAIERKVRQGQDTTIEVRLFNLESIESENVDVEYFVKDISGNTILTESETVVVKTQASFFKTISIPKNLKSGPYIFAALSKFGNSVGTASYLFEVIGLNDEDPSFVDFCKNSVMCLGLSLATIMLLFSLMAYFYFFIGAYLYEKISGKEMLQKGKQKEMDNLEEIKDAPGFFERMKKWSKERSKRKEKEREKSRKEEEAEKKKAYEEKRRKEKEERKERIAEARVRAEEIRAEESGKEIKEKSSRKTPGFFENLSSRLKKWSEENKKKKAEEEKRRVQSLAREAKKQEPVKPSNELKSLYSSMEMLEESADKKDFESLDKFYIKARDTYMKLDSYEQRQVYSKLMQLYKIRNDIVEEKRREEEKLQQKQKKEERKKLEDEIKKKAAAKEEKKAAFRENILGMMHTFGVYKTPEERKRIDILKEKKRKEAEKARQAAEKQKKLDESRKQKELRKQEELQQKIRLEEEQRKQKEAEILRKEQEKRQREELKRQKEEEKQRKLQEIEAEKAEEARIKLEEEEQRRKAEEEKKLAELQQKEEAKRLKETERQRVVEELQRKKEEQIQIALQEEQRKKEEEEENIRVEAARKEEAKQIREERKQRKLQEIEEKKAQEEMKKQQAVEMKRLKEEERKNLEEMRIKEEAIKKEESKKQREEEKKRRLIEAEERKRKKYEELEIKKQKGLEEKQRILAEEEEKIRLNYRFSQL